jgi:hypothetical protein
MPMLESYSPYLKYIGKIANPMCLVYPKIASPMCWLAKFELRQKKNYESSKISPCKNIIFKKHSLKETKILQGIITL